MRPEEHEEEEKRVIDHRWSEEGEEKELCDNDVIRRETIKAVDEGK